MQIKAYLHRYSVSPGRFFFLTNSRNICAKYNCCTKNRRCPLFFGPYQLYYCGGNLRKRGLYCRFPLTIKSLSGNKDMCIHLKLQHRPTVRVQFCRSLNHVHLIYMILYLFPEQFAGDLNDSFHPGYRSRNGRFVCLFACLFVCLFVFLHATISCFQPP